MKSDYIPMESILYRNVRNVLTIINKSSTVGVGKLSARITGVLTKFQARAGKSSSKYVNELRRTCCVADCIWKELANACNCKRLGKNANCSLPVY